MELHWLLQVSRPVRCSVRFMQFMLNETNLPLHPIVKELRDVHSPPRLAPFLLPI